MSEQTPGAAGTQQVQVQIKEDKTNTVYSNVCRIFSSHNAEELVVDFAVTMPSSDRADVLVMDVNTRVVMNYFAAKRLALSLSQAVQRYEQQFGALELDPRRRFKQG